MGYSDRQQSPLNAFVKDCVKALAIFLVVAAVVVAGDWMLVLADAKLGGAAPPSGARQVSHSPY
jgi:hypothetical protein